MIVIVALVTQWARQDGRVAARTDRHLEPGTDDSWEAYNAMLAKLEHPRRRRRPRGAADRFARLASTSAPPTPPAESRRPRVRARQGRRTAAARLESLHSRRGGRR